MVKKMCTILKRDENKAIFTHFGFIILRVDQHSWRFDGTILQVASTVQKILILNVILKKSKGWIIALFLMAQFPLSHLARK